ncbi:6-hydroxy-D-nicotine oxidase [Penicillium odoratum]|uniref:6-hydroxy-D-nicotine oxidase n=1 Tax=Penicillium odoratum TaxID=1167516 RepID=UPI00254803C2|nr:6-hydroxy-D-nicotine oxidase [Penicillium odoratum]KAJ5745066.1 6-hydroxy-D-nicotine oxidase [Penicillium odoratum]
MFVRELARGLRALIIANAEFAVCGGGHMSTLGSKNTEGGVLVGIWTLTDLQLSHAWVMAL